MTKLCISCGTCKVTTDNGLGYETFMMILWFLNAFENSGNPENPRHTCVEMPRVLSIGILFLQRNMEIVRLVINKTMREK